MNKQILKQAIETYGVHQQLLMVVEECGELSHEILKRLRDKLNRDKIIEETADVLIMIEQLKLMLNITESELNEEIKIKVDRLERRLSK